MSFGKQKIFVERRADFDLDYPEDLRLVKELEKKLIQYRDDCEKGYNVISGKNLGLFDLYCVKIGLIKFTEKYPDGAVVLPNDYAVECKKYRALQELRRKRKYAQEKNREGFLSGNYNF